MAELPRRLGELLGSVGGAVGATNPAQTGRLWSSWRQIVGPEVAGHAEPTSLRGGVLRVRTDSPAWATEIGYLGAEIRKRANETLGCEAVRQVRVWTGPGAMHPAPDPRHPAPVERSQRRPATEPREAFENARSAWLERRRRAGGRVPDEREGKGKYPGR